MHIFTKGHTLNSVPNPRNRAHQREFAVKEGSEVAGSSDLSATELLTAFVSVAEQATSVELSSAVGWRTVVLPRGNALQS